MMILIVKDILSEKIVLSVNSLDHIQWNLPFIFKTVLSKIQMCVLLATALAMNEDR